MWFFHSDLTLWFCVSDSCIKRNSRYGRVCTETARVAGAGEGGRAGGVCATPWEHVGARALSSGNGIE